MHVIANADGAGDEGEHRYQQARHFLRPRQPRIEAVAQNNRQRHNRDHRQNGSLRNEQHDFVRNVVELHQLSGQPLLVHGHSSFPLLTRLHSAFPPLFGPFPLAFLYFILCERGLLCLAMLSVFDGLHRFFNKK